MKITTSVMFSLCVVWGLMVGQCQADQFIMPPHKFEHWPNMPTLVLQEDITQIDSLCHNPIQGFAPNIVNRTGWVISGCSVGNTYLGDFTSEAYSSCLFISDKDCQKVIKFMSGPSKMKCVVFVPHIKSYKINDHWTMRITPDYLNLIYWHELSHCNGWHHEDHPTKIAIN